MTVGACLHAAYYFLLYCGGSGEINVIRTKYDETYKNVMSVIGLQLRCGDKPVERLVRLWLMYNAVQPFTRNSIIINIDQRYGHGSTRDARLALRCHVCT